MTRVLSKNCGYITHWDRGYAHVKAQQDLHDDGIYSMSCIPANRVGLPRQLIKMIGKEMTCPKGCTHVGWERTTMFGVTGNAIGRSLESD